MIADRHQAIDRAPRGLPSTRRGQLTRQRLIDCGLAEFAERGFVAARVESITAAAGVAYGTFYRYFRSKADLVRALADDVYSEIFAQATKEVRSERPVYERVFNDYLLSLQAFTCHRDSLRVLNDAVGADPDVAASIARLQERDVERYAEIITSTPGYDPVVDPYTVSLMVNAMGDEVAHRWIRSDRCTGDVDKDGPDLQRLARLFALMCTAALAPASLGVGTATVAEIMERIVPDDGLGPDAERIPA